MNKAKFILVAAGISLAMAFTLSCADSSSGSEEQNPSSSSAPPSSSSSVYVGTGGKGNNIANYKTKTIGTQTWMAENLDYNVSGSKCYGNLDSNCDIYGRLYDWSTAMALPSSCNSSICASQVSAKHRGICPAGWHIPTNAEWDVLYRYVDGTSGTSSPYDSPTAGRHLKAASGWDWNDRDDISGNGTDSFGFAALPGGLGYSDGSFSIAGDRGYWWSSSEYNGRDAYLRYMGYYSEFAYWDYNGKAGLFSIRCLQD